MNVVLKELVERVQEEGAVIVTFANSAYLKILNNWLDHLAALEIKNFFVIAMDDELARDLENRNIAYYLAPCESGRHHVWGLRLRLVSEILELGVGVIMSDADAIWLRDPRPELFENSGADLAISQGTKFPVRAFHAWGFVLCFGFFYAAPTSGARDLFACLSSIEKADLDDQRELNLEILRRGIKWQFKDHTMVRLPNGGRMIGAKSRITGHASGLKVDVLPFDRYQRAIVSIGRGYVVHPLTPRPLGRKIWNLRRHGLWGRKAARVAEMIRSQGFWFVDVPRTSSSSIRAELSRDFGRANGKRHYFNRDRKYAVRQILQPHRTAIAMRRRLGEELWEEIFTFGFIRNPYDRVWSMFCYLTHHQKNVRPRQFRNFVHSIGKGRRDVLIKPVSRFLTDSDGRVLVDRICRYEDREKELGHIGDQIGTKFAGIVAQAAGRHRKHYADYYDEAAKERVDAFYAKDFELGQYPMEIPQ